MSFLKKYSDTFSYFSKWAILNYIIVFFFRLWEVISAGSTGKGIDIFNGFLGDLIIISAAFLPLLLVFGLIATKSVKWASFLMGFFTVTFWLLMVPVQAYFHATNDLADLNEMGCKPGVSFIGLFGISIYYWILPLAILLILVGAFLWSIMNNRLSFGKWMGKVLAALFLVSFPLALEFGYNTDFFNQNNQRISKPFYYVKTSVVCISRTLFGANKQLTGTALYQSLYNNEDAFVLPDEYPLLRRYQPRNCLDDLIRFSPDGEKPDIVFLIVESLSDPFIRSFKGVEFMPFLSEMSDSSIYWQNFVATSQRWSGSLPSIAGGLPFADKGFSQIPLIPYHFSLFNVFNYNNYQTSYYTGNWTWAHSTDKFLELNNVTRVFDAADFPSERKMDIRDYDGSFWGYHDKDLFGFYFEQKDSQQHSAPTFDLIQTGSTRWPFPVDSLPYYEARFDQLLGNVTDTDIKEYFLLHRKYFYSLMFSDDMIRNFFETYSTKENYDNTIFILTGNITMPDIITAKGFEKYKVPFMIYSPLIKESRTIQSVASHADIYETIVGLMASHTDFKAPTYTVSVGADLCEPDTGKKPFVTFADSIGQIKELYYDGYFLTAANKVYKIENGVTNNEVTDKKIHASMINYLSAFNQVNSTVSAGLMPDSLFFESFGYEILKDTIVTGQRIRDEYRDILHNIPLGEDIHYIDVRLDNPQVALEEVFVVYEIRNSNDSILQWGNFGIPENKVGFSLRIVLDEEFDNYENVWLKVFIWNQSPVPYSFDKARTILFKKG